jgi:4a-hydroxytetrahydrobiopterin dehydratase
MADLATEQCVATRPDSPKVSSNNLTVLSAQVPEWAIVNDGLDKLERTFKFGSFAEALAFTNRVGDAAEEQDHHPELVTSYGQTAVRWWTHTVGGLHRNDFIMAARTDALYAG